MAWIDPNSYGLSAQNTSRCHGCTKNSVYPFPMEMAGVQATRLRRPNLVFARVGDRSLHKSWLADQTCARNWDLQLSFYGRDESLVQDGDLPLIVDAGMKLDAIARHFIQHPELLDKYDYIMIPDDDLLMQAHDLNRLFDIAAQYDLTIAQPALAVQSYIAHPILLRSPDFMLRYSTYIEIMGAVMKTSYFKQLLPMMSRYMTGWGIDWVWAMAMENPAYRAAIVDACEMVHTRPVASGPLYSKFKDANVIPEEELRDLRGSFENMPKIIQLYGGVLRNGKKVGSVETRLRNAASFVAAAPSAREPLRLLKAGIGSIVRAVTTASYKPEKLRPRKDAEVTAYL